MLLSVANQVIRLNRVGNDCTGVIMDLNTLPKTSHLSRENSSSETNVANVDAVDVTDTDTDKVTSVVAKALSSVVSSSSVNKNKKLKPKTIVLFSKKK